MTFADKIEYMNMNDGVQFGFYPSISERTRGYIRMMPLAIKPTITNSEDLVSVDGGSIKMIDRAKSVKICFCRCSNS